LRLTLLRAVLLLAVQLPGRTWASAVTIPDDYATIQTAIDAGADTVFVREGEYTEVPQAYRGVTLLGLGTMRPRIAGLAITNPYGWLSRTWRISGVDIAGPVGISTPNPDARLLDITFDRCRLTQGIQHDSYDPYDIYTLSLSHCWLGGQSDGRAAVLTMHADTSTAGWSWNVEEFASVDTCWFSGGANQALRVGGEDQASASIVGNVIENTPRGLYLPGLGYPTIQSNVVRHAGVGVELDGRSALIEGNEISDCGVGLRRWWGDATFSDNRIINAATVGAHFVFPDGVRAERNVIGMCGGPAVFVQTPLLSSLLFTQNTIYQVGGSGILVTGGSVDTLTVEENIGYGASAWGLQFLSTVASSSTLGCNDWFANGLGAVTGAQASDSDFIVNPCFCDVDSNDVRLYSDSQLLNRPQCTQIGARGIGCSPPTLKALNVSSNQAGLELGWEFNAVHSVESWIERANQEGGRWDSLGTGSSTGSNSFGLLDRAVAPNHAYNYRVAWRDRGTLVRGSPVSGSWTDAGRLSSVSPNPTIGDVNVDWVLSRPSVTDIRVYDLAGREIAVVARGSFNVGRNRARWDGQWAGRGVAPAGMYIVRITTSERTTSHRVLLIR